MFLLQFFKKIIFFPLFFILASSVLAQVKTKVTVSPFLFEEKVFPGEIFEREIILTNQSDEKLDFVISINDFRVDEKGNIFLLPPKSERFSLADWVEIKENEIQLLPGESKIIKILFKIPEQEAVGSRYGAIIFTSKKEFIRPEREGVFGLFSHQIGVLIFLSSNQKIIEEAKILEFKTDKKFYFNSSPIKFQIVIENLGNVWIEPLGKIEIENFFRKKIAEIPFNRQKFKILPERKRNFEEIWQRNFGFLKLNATLYLIFGTPSEQGGSGIKIIMRKTDFWVFPLKIIFLSLLILVLLGYIVFKVGKKFKTFSKK